MSISSYLKHLLTSALTITTVCSASQVFADEHSGSHGDHFGVSAYIGFHSALTQTLAAGDAVVFDSDHDAQRHHPVRLIHPTNNLFLVEVPGEYLIDFGVKGVGLDAVDYGFYLQQVHNGITTIRARFLDNTSSSVIINLRKGDTIQLIAEQDVVLAPSIGPVPSTDTAFITFVKLNDH